MKQEIKHSRSKPHHEDYHNTQEVKKRRKQLLTNKSASEKIGDLFRSFDFYGEQVQLSYKGESAYKTFVGASLSILMLITILAYSANLLKVLIIKSQTEVSTSTTILNLNEEGPFRPQDLGFDFAFGVASGPMDPAIAYIKVRMSTIQYLDEQDEQGNYLKNASYRYLDYDECGEEYFNFYDKKQVETIGINKLLCLINDDYSLEGDFYSNTFQQIQLQVWKCINGTSDVICKSQTEIDTYLNSNKFQFSFINTLFSRENYTDPIEYYLDDSLYLYMEADKLKVTNFYIMKYELELEDAMLQFGQEAQVSTYQVQNFRSLEAKQQDVGGILQINVRLDKQFDVTNRKVYGVLQFFGDIGGLQSCLYMFGVLFVVFFQKRLFISSVSHDIYQIKRDHNKGQVNGVSSPIQHLAGEGNYGFSQRDQIMKAKTIEPKAGQILEFQNLTDELQSKTPAGGGNTSKSAQAYHHKILAQKYGEGSQEFNEQILQKKLKQANHLKLKNINTITRAIIQRDRLVYTFKHILAYLFQCLCCRSLSSKRNKVVHKPHYYFEKADQKLQQELDIVNFLKSMRYMKLFSQILLSQRQRMLLRFQRRHVIESESSSSDSDDDKYEMMRLKEHKNPMIRLMIYGKIKRMMVWYLGKKLTKKDKNLLRGLFKKKLKDFDEDFNAQLENKTLLQRLKEQLIKLPANTSLESSKYIPTSPRRMEKDSNEDRDILRFQKEVDSQLKEQDGFHFTMHAAKTDQEMMNHLDQWREQEEPVKRFDKLKKDSEFENLVKLSQQYQNSKSQPFSSNEHETQILKQDLGPDEQKLFNAEHKVEHKEHQNKTISRTLMML